MEKGKETMPPLTIGTKREAVAGLQEDIGREAEQALMVQRDVRAELKVATEADRAESGPGRDDGHIGIALDTVTIRIKVGTTQGHTRNALAIALKELEEIRERHSAAQIGSLVRVRIDRDEDRQPRGKSPKSIRHLLIISGGNGRKVTLKNGLEVLCVSPESPIGQALLISTEKNNEHTAATKGTVIPWGDTSARVEAIV